MFCRSVICVTALAFSMSLLWKIALDGEESNRLLFIKLSATEAECNACQKRIKLSNRGPANLKDHLSAHPTYQKKLQQMEEEENTKKDAMKQGMAKFVIRGTGTFSLSQLFILSRIGLTCNVLQEI
jgi:hypothetical protein